MYSSYTLNTSVTDVFFAVNLGELSLPKNTSVVYVIMPGLRIHRNRCILRSKPGRTVTTKEYIGSICYYAIPTMYSSYTITYEEYIGYRCILRSKPGWTVTTDVFFGSMCYRTCITEFYIGKDSLPRFTTMNTSVVRRILRLASLIVPDQNFVVFQKNSVCIV